MSSRWMPQHFAAELPASNGVDAFGDNQGLFNCLQSQAIDCIWWELGRGQNLPQTSPGTARSYPE